MWIEFLWPKLVPYVEIEDFVGNSEEEEGDHSEIEDASEDGIEDDIENVSVDDG